MAASTALIKDALSRRKPATALMNLVLHGEMSYGRALWWWQQTYGTEASLREASENEGEEYDGPTMYEQELMSMPR